MINIALTQPYAKLDDALQADETFQLALAKMLENQSCVLRGKVLLTYLLLFKMNPQWFVIAIEMDFYKNIDKLLRDNFKYVQCCLLCLIESVSEMSPKLISDCQEAFKSCIATKDGTLPGQTKDIAQLPYGIRHVLQKSKSQYSSLRGPLLYILAFTEMLNSSSFKQKLAKPDLIEMLAQNIISSESVKSKQVDEFRAANFLVAESLAKHPKILNLMAHEILEKLLPQIAGKIDSQLPDTRFNALKLFTDYVTQFICEEKLY